MYRNTSKHMMVGSAETYGYVLYYRDRRDKDGLHRVSKGAAE